MSVSNFAANQFGSCLQVGGRRMFIFLFVTKQPCNGHWQPWALIAIQLFPVTKKVDPVPLKTC